MEREEGRKRERIEREGPPRGKALTFLLLCQPLFHTLLYTLSSRGMADGWEGQLEELERA